MLRQAAASEPMVSMPRAPSSITKVSKPASRASSAVQATPEIGREPGDEDALEAALLEVAFEPGLGLAVRLLEARVAVDPAVVALADDELRMRDLQLLGAARALDAVIRPQHLVA